jgi:hypothetical protein
MFSRSAASLIFEIANFALVGSLAIGVVATVFIIWMGRYKEEYQALDVASANASAELAKASGAKAAEKAAGLEVQAKELQLDVERERTARIELERKYGPRVLRPDEQTRLAAALREQHVTRVLILRVDEMEAAVAADNIKQAMEAAGVKVDVGSLGTIVPPRYGAAVYDPKGPQGPLAKAFSSIAALPFESTAPHFPVTPMPAMLIYLKPFPL